MWVTLSRGGAIDKLYLIFHITYRIHKRLHCQSRAQRARMIDIQPAIQLTPKTSAIHDSSRDRVPLHELQMLTQSVASREYVHAYTPISVRIKTLSIIILYTISCYLLFTGTLARRAHVYIRMYARR